MRIAVKVDDKGVQQITESGKFTKVLIVVSLFVTEKVFLHLKVKNYREDENS